LYANTRSGRLGQLFNEQSLFPFSPSGGFSFSPTGAGSLSFSTPDWVSDIWGATKDVLGDVADDLVGEIGEWIQRRIGREAWERMPETAKREAIVAAREDLQCSAGAFASSSLPLLIAGAALLFIIMQPTRRPRRRRR